ncbi:CNNM family magnesium/cobalt transport protein CorC [Flocculibacter collagenilyticus]|uniref:CNNM family magnesium/cobalt transport protein CorC n=1 Tax=Flocculibacter collagenilyticus TaxID=2744479 RepID=UPI0018F4357E|nr:CNNM family magnesium/cobalt transport protein CorC [Flocculibacter collagenilyticus]
MSDENPHSSNGSSNKTWLDKIATMFQGEPQKKEDLVDVIHDAEQRDLIDPQTKEMIEGVLEVSDMRVREIMIPRSQMVTIDIDQSLEEFLPIVLESAHSRFPIINEDKDHVEGILLAKDLLSYAFKQETNVNLADVIRPAVIIPESKRVDILLKEFRQERYHMAIVVDEYGGVSGLVTIEDILELIVGEIEDETDVEVEHEDIKKVAKHVYTVQALTPVDEFNTFFNSTFDESDADTIGGIVLHAFGHMPGRGETIEVNDYLFKIMSADNRRIQQLQVTIPKAEVLLEHQSD